MPGPAAPDFIRYLAAKKGLDDRSLNRQVWDHLVRAVRDREDSAPLRVLEVGCGIGTMVERLLDGGLLTRAAYTGVDVEPEFIRAAAQRLHGYAAGRQVPLTLDAGGAMLFSTPAQDVRITFEAADLFDFLDREPGSRPGTCWSPTPFWTSSILPPPCPASCRGWFPAGCSISPSILTEPPSLSPPSIRTWTP